MIINSRITFTGTTAQKFWALLILPFNSVIGALVFITELNAFYFINKAISLYGNFYYLINPREQNGVPAALGGRPIPDVVKKASGDVMSVPDGYSIRAGAYFNVNKWAFSAGLRRRRYSGS
ncbi:MAG: hypothetical protein ABIO81_09305 [Ginsengibacter sp.]